MEYVVAAYAVIWFVLMLYVVGVGLRTARLTRETELMARVLAEHGEGPAEGRAADEAAGVGR
ncbi:MAG TPA: hypothetical protein VNT51_07905 [Miltoncostaeaceae bacterium]|nr:hypothetical protein [Miltoncostaeaceae bacterium]